MRKPIYVRIRVEGFDTFDEEKDFIDTLYAQVSLVEKAKGANVTDLYTTHQEFTS